MCRRQCQRRPLSVALNFHAERSSLQTAGDLNITNHTILNTFKLYARRIRRFASLPEMMSPLSSFNPPPTKIQLKTWACFPTSNTFNTSLTLSLNHRHLLRRQQTYTLAPLLRCSIILLSNGNTMLRVALRRTFKTMPTSCLRRVQSTNISSVGSRWKAWWRTMTKCWWKKWPLCVSQASKMVIASRHLWLALQMIRLSGSGNYTLSRIWDGITITNALSNTEVETSSKA